MLVNKAYRYELKPNQEQLTLLKKHAGCARFAWNWGLAERIRLWEEEKKSTN
ncbi:Helix-turn-helix domain-containing protein, partial [Thermosyntropha lipolytica DSM 11003]